MKERTELTAEDFRWLKERGLLDLYLDVQRRRKELVDYVKQRLDKVEVAE